MVDLFEQEQNLLKAWGHTADLKDITNYILDNDLSKDQIVNMLLGLTAIMDIRMEQAWKDFEKSFKEITELRQQSTINQAWSAKIV